MRVCKCGSDFSFRHFLATSCCKCASDKSKDYAKRTGMQAANSAVAKAIRSGLLTPAKDHLCVDCGKQAMDYDHRDYGRPLHVEPVCRSYNKLRGPGKPITGGEVTLEDMLPELNEKETSNV